MEVGGPCTEVDNRWAKRLVGFSKGGVEKEKGQLPETQMRRY